MNWYHLAFQIGLFVLIVWPIAVVLHFAFKVYDSLYVLRLHKQEQDFLQRWYANADKGERYGNH
jgi:hypothetical protein